MTASFLYSIIYVYIWNSYRSIVYNYCWVKTINHKHIIKKITMNNSVDKINLIQFLRPLSLSLPAYYFIVYCLSWRDDERKNLNEQLKPAWARETLAVKGGMAIHWWRQLIAAQEWWVNRNYGHIQVTTITSRPYAVCVTDIRAVSTSLYILLKSIITVLIYHMLKIQRVMCACTIQTCYVTYCLRLRCQNDMKW